MNTPLARFAGSLGLPVSLEGMVATLLDRVSQVDDSYIAVKHGLLQK